MAQVEPSSGSGPAPAASTSTIPAIGIDLGTTYSCVGVFRQGAVEIIPNETGNRTTPSYVAFSDEGRTMGESAKAQAAMNPLGTVYDAKRLIGRGIRDEGVQRDLELFPFKVVEKSEGNVAIEVNWKGEIKHFAPEEISAMLLSKLRDDASKYIGTEIVDAVITVPAYFNDIQRSKTKLAGTIAGLNVKRIINEPTAAAIAYGLDRKAAAAGGLGGASQNILIFDLGGGTFDVSLLQIQDGIFEVKATNGDTHLGGEDFDNVCVDFFSKEFRRVHKKDLSENPRSLRRLRNAVEKAKRVLSSSTTTALHVDSLFEGEDFEVQFTRAKFEELNAANFKRLLKPVDQVLSDAKMRKTDVNEVVLVGGSTRIPKVQAMLQEYFKGKELNKSINPDEAVAYGAAVQAAILSGQGGSTCQDLLLLDVTPLSLGIEVVGRQMSVIIKRNTPIPCRKTEPFTTEEDNQTEVDIDIYEGERPQTQHNHLLGHFVLTGVPPCKRGVPEIEVTFDLDANGILNVTARDKASGSTGHVTITNKMKGSDEEVKRMCADAERFRKQDEEELQRQKARNSLQEYIFSVKDAADQLADKLAKMELSGEAKEVVATAESILEWLDEDTGSTLEDINAKQKQLESVWNPLAARAYA